MTNPTIPQPKHTASRCLSFIGPLVTDSPRVLQEKTFGRIHSTFPGAGSAWSRRRLAMAPKAGAHWPILADRSEPRLIGGDLFQALACADDASHFSQVGSSVLSGKDRQGSSDHFAIEYRSLELPRFT